MKFAWHSNAPWAATGYGNQTKLFVPRLKELGHDIAVIAFWGLEGGLIKWDGVPIYPKGKHPYGVDVLSAHTHHFGTNVAITLIDAWVMQPEAMQSTLWIPWFPVDMYPLPAAVVRTARRAFERIVFSKYALEQVENAGLSAYYVPHGIDTKEFKPENQINARELLQWPKDAFIVGMVAANKGMPSRKAFSYQIEAFANFKKRHSDAILYLHTVKGEHGENEGMNIPEFCNYLGLRPDLDVMFVEQYQNAFGFLNEEYMNTIYNAMDVHMLVSMGEGFGIPIVEAQATGCPVIVGDWTAMSELCFSGWKVPESESDKWWTPLAAYQYVPRVGAIEDALEQAYRMKGNQDYRKRARKGALAYDADKVTQKYWKPVLEDIEEKVKIWQPT